MKPDPTSFFPEKWYGVPEPTADFTGKTVIVTGSNVGIGFEAAALYTALHAAKVILAVRTLSKGTAAQNQIEERSGRKGVVEVWELDMDSSPSIQKFADRVNRDLERLDVAVLNAGIVAKGYEIGADGHERLLQVNVLGMALLGLLLLPKMKASKTSEQDTPHLIFVGSESHRWLEDNDFDDPTPYGGNILECTGARPTDPAKWDPTVQYARSKLMTQYVSNSIADLARKPNGEIDTIVTSVCPGACRSTLMRGLTGLKNWIVLGLCDLLFTKPTEQGARCYVAASALGAEGHGAWYKTYRLHQ